MIKKLDWLGRILLIVVIWALLVFGVERCDSLKLARAEDPVTDPIIVGIALATDRVQIEGSEYVLPRIEYFDLKNFANAMVIDYRNYQATLRDYAKRQDMIPEESKLSLEVLERGKVALAELKNLTGRSLEKRYTDYQIELHERTLETMNKVFLPNVRSRELEKLIRQLKPVVEGRLEWVVRIRAQYPLIDQNHTRDEAVLSAHR